ncbi:MAG: hypothetical protein ACJAWL_001391 [Motiliproteus sp.]|jgi:hypothetical protein
MFRPDRLVLRVCYPLAGLVVVIHLLMMAGSLASTLPLPIRLLLLGAVSWQAVYLLRRYVFLSHPRSIREIRWTRSSWFVRLADGSETLVRPAPGCRLYGRISLLRFQVLSPVAGQNPYLSTWLISEHRSAQAIRRLRVQLLLTYSNQNCL